MIQYKYRMLLKLNIASVFCIDCSKVFTHSGPGEVTRDLITPEVSHTT